MGMILEFKNLSRSLEQRGAFIRVSGAVEAGSVLVVKGTSGSGKSTLLRMLARIIPADSGDVYWQGRHWLSIPPTNWRRSINYLSQKPVMLSGSVEDNLRLPFSLSEIKSNLSYTPPLAEQYMKSLGLPPDLLRQSAQTLSGGEAARVALIRSLLIEPEVLLLDEPGAYLDAGSRSMLVQLLGEWVRRKPERGIIIVSHSDDELERLSNSSILTMEKPGGA